MVGECCGDEGLVGGMGSLYLSRAAARVDNAYASIFATVVFLIVHSIVVVEKTHER
jgi:hypothetical protein